MTSTFLPNTLSPRKPILSSLSMPGLHLLVLSSILRLVFSHSVISNQTHQDIAKAGHLAKVGPPEGLLLATFIGGPLNPQLSRTIQTICKMFSLLQKTFLLQHHFPLVFFFYHRRSVHINAFYTYALEALAQASQDKHSK